LTSQTKPNNGQQRCFRFPFRLGYGQLSGINAILYYLHDTFAFAGFNKVSSDLQAVAIGATNLVFTMLAVSVIDRIGRKTLLLIGSVGTAACHPKSTLHNLKSSSS